MKKFSKILSVALLVALVLSLGVASAFAADPPTYTITINNKVSGFTYTAYQIFTGDLDNGVLSNVEWGNGITAAGKEALYTRYSLTGENQTARKVAEAIAAVGTSDMEKQAEADAIATLLAKTTSGALETGTNLVYDDSTEGSECYKAAGLASGYYIVVNSVVPDGVEITFSDYIVQLVNNVSIAPKSGTPESEKKVQDINDSDATPTLTNLQDSADYDIGDDVPYTLTMTLPSDYANYSSYKLVFYDDMSKGLTYKTGSAKIKYGGAEENAFTDPTEGTSSYENGHMWVWTIADLKTAASNLKAGDKVTITYYATLNKDAVVGVAGNPNKMHVEFSNNPNGNQTGKTPDDINIVFTYKTVFNKVDGDKKPLTGADFKLEKKVNGQWVDVTTLGSGENHPSKTVTGTEAKEPEGTEGEDGYKPAVPATESCVFTFSGLDDGDYRLTETKTPAGYNTIDPIEFTITASHDIKSADPRLTALTGTDGHEFNMTPVKEGSNLTGELDADVINNSGATLPSTGGIGTTIFYVVGGVLVLAAIILLVTKKRMSE